MPTVVTALLVLSAIRINIIDQHQFTLTMRIIVHRIPGFLPVILALMLTASAVLAQKPVLKSVDFKDFEKQSAKKIELNKRVYTEYDRNGTMIKQETYARNELAEISLLQSINVKITPKATYQTINKYDSLGQQSGSELIVLDLKGKKQKSINAVFVNGEEKSRYISYFEYNKFGKLTSMKQYNLLQQLIAEENHEFNATNEEIVFSSWRYVDANMKTKEQTKKTTEYNDKGGMLKTLSFRKVVAPDGVKEYKEEITFDDRNLVKEWIKYTNGAVTSRYIRGGSVDMGVGAPKSTTPIDYGSYATESEYDDNGNKTKTTYTESDPETGEDVVTQVNTFEYDDNGNLVKTSKIFYEGEVERTEEDIVEYDKYNNIVRKASYKDGEIISENIYAYEYHSN